MSWQAKPRGPPDRCRPGRGAWTLTSRRTSTTRRGPTSFWTRPAGRGLAARFGPRAGKSSASSTGARPPASDQRSWARSATSWRRGASRWGAQFCDTSGNEPQSLVARQFDIAEFAWVSSYDPGSDALFNMASAAVPSKTNGFQGGNYGNYRNPRSDVLLKQLQTSLDPSFRRVALKEAQTIWQSDLPVLPLLLRPITTAASTRLVGFRPTPAPAGETWNIEQWSLAPQ